MLPTPMMGQLIEYGAFLSLLGTLSFSLSHVQKGRRAEEAACTCFSFYITPALSTSKGLHHSWYMKGEGYTKCGKDTNDKVNDLSSP